MAIMFLRGWKGKRPLMSSATLVISQLDKEIGEGKRPCYNLLHKELIRIDYDLNKYLSPT